MTPGRELAARASLSLLAVALVVGGGIARLRRISRPTAVTVGLHADGAVREVVIMLKGRVLGRAIVCGGREHLSHPGRNLLRVIDLRAEEGTLTVAGDGERALVIRGRDCASRVLPLKSLQSARIGAASVALLGDGQSATVALPAPLGR